MEQGEHQLAFDHFALALKKSSENIVALNCLVRESYQLGCVENALPYLEDTLKSGVEAEAVRVTLAGCLIYLGRAEEARQHLEAVLGANPANINAKELFDTMAIRVGPAAVRRFLTVSLSLLLLTLVWQYFLAPALR